MNMMVCRICGGEIHYTPQQRMALCDSCGSAVMLTRRDNAVMLALHNKATMLRQEKQFAAAGEIYEGILQQFPDDAEAHWGSVLCRYGVVFVLDPHTGIWKPTMHQLQVASVLEDADYIAALRCADEQSRALYAEQAESIADIQRRIQAVRSREQPCDVFISYKESAEDGSRTRDSVIAQEIYDALTEKGYRVFYSRISLKHRLGEEYEAQIFSALLSARVMLVVGTRADYIQSEWVSNEWQRFLYLKQQDPARQLYPVYEDLTLDQLPADFLFFPPTDYSRRGALQDLIRNLDKVLSAHTAKASAAVHAPSIQAQRSSAAQGLLESATTCLQDGNFVQADEMLNQAIALDDHYAPLYLAKLLVELQLQHPRQLAEQADSFTYSPNWKKALRYADYQQRAEYESYIANKQTWQEAQAAKLMAEADAADTRRKLIGVIHELRRLTDVPGVEACLQACRQRLTETDDRVRRLCQSTDSIPRMIEAIHLLQTYCRGYTGCTAALMKFHTALQLALEQMLCCYSGELAIFTGKDYLCTNEQAMLRALKLTSFDGVTQVAPYQDSKGKCHAAVARNGGMEVTGYGMFDRDVIKRCQAQKDVAFVGYDYSEECGKIGPVCVDREGNLFDLLSKSDRPVKTNVLALAENCYAIRQAEGVFKNHTDIENELQHVRAYGDYYVTLNKNGCCQVINASAGSNAAKPSASYSCMAAVGSINGFMFLHNDGTVSVSHKPKEAVPNVKGWKNIVAIFCAFDDYIGFAADGSILSTNPEWEQRLASWHGVLLRDECRSAAAKKVLDVLLKETFSIQRTLENSIDVEAMRQLTDVTDAVCVKEMTVFLHRDGSVCGYGRNADALRQLSAWERITRLSGNNSWIAGFRADGTMECTNQQANDFYRLVPQDTRLDLQTNCPSEENIRGICSMPRQILTVPNCIYALDREGHVHARTTIVQILYSPAQLTQLKNALIVPETWQNIVQLANTETHLFGLMSNGTVCCCPLRESSDKRSITDENGYYHYGYQVEAWQGIRAIAAGAHHVAGLTDQGTVLICGGRILLGEEGRFASLSARSGKGNSFKQIDALYDPETWTDIAAIAAGYSYTIGIRRDGTVVASGDGWA